MLAAIQALGRSLPATVTSRTGSIVTVNFEIANTPSSPYTLPPVTMPMIGSEYLRLPIQPGCKGWVIPADAYLGGMSGLGGGTADLVMRANLSSLVWSPMGNKGWAASEDDNAAVLYGPDGAIIRTADKACSVTVNANGVVVKVPAGKSLSITNLPTASAGLPSGSLWRSGTQVMVVP